MSDHSAGTLLPDTAEVDPVCAAATERAREVAVDIAEVPAHVGETVGIAAAGQLTAVHRFSCLHPGYAGWVWAVTVSRVEDSDEVTVDEAWLEPGEGALLAPQWRPWSERVQPGDLGVGDVFPTADDDPRLTAGFTAEDDLDTVVADQPLHPLQWQLGLGRRRVLSALGRDDAADRWISGDGGPDSAVARAATEHCVTCGWLMPIGGPLGQAFGACAQPMSPSDGRIVSMLHGCGAHSEVVVEPSAPAIVDVIVDDTIVDTFDIDAEDPGAVEVELDATEEREVEVEAVEVSDVDAVEEADEEAVEEAVEEAKAADLDAVDQADVESDSEPDGSAEPDDDLRPAARRRST